jgi:hypothetical protein
VGTHDQDRVPRRSRLYRRLIEASGRCPPGDVRGPFGYTDLLEAISDPKQTPRRAHGVD